MAPQDMPRLCCTTEALAGNCWSLLQVASSRRSTSEGSTPAMAMASRPASADISVTFPSTWRAPIPLRSRIHSSEVSTISARSWLVSLRSGRWVAQPVMRPWAMGNSVVRGPDGGPVGPRRRLATAHR